ncbi:hypothetical protein FPV67DRAFT_1676776 [Lyophyllum atratum]|nr:hypothetical protein FPV67DRAFT_1676776 [Lyophyllum atratum]
MRVGSPRDHLLGHLSYDLKKPLLGRGTFKTAQTATLAFLSASPPEGLGSKCDTSTESTPTPVALKRPYFHRKSDLGKDEAKRPILRFAFSEEVDAVMNEANLLCWATSLLDSAQAHVEKLVKSRLPDTAPFKIPYLRFVQAGIAISLRDIDPKAVSVSTNRAAYLLEELLPANRKSFQKYVHNGKAKPLTEPHEANYDIAEYCCFIQHIQFMLTEGLAFISDFQGKSSIIYGSVTRLKAILLQIMTHPSLGDDLFGGGNIGKIFKLFPVQHSCNRFCEWFDLPMAELPDDDASGDEDEGDVPGVEEEEEDALTPNQPLPTGTKHDPIPIQ